MEIKIYKDRLITPSVFRAGTMNENNSTEITLSFEKGLEDYNKRIVFITPEGNKQDLILNDTYLIKNDITKYEKVRAYLLLTKENIDWRSIEIEMIFNKNENPDSNLPEEEYTDLWNTMITVLEDKITTVDNLVEEIQTKLDNMNIEDGNGINSLQQKFESTSWNTSNDVVKQYIKDDTANGDGNKISYEEIEGKYSINVITNGKSAFNQNGKSQTVGGKSHTEGSKNIAFESNSHAEGNETFAGGKHSHAEGNTTSATGNASHSEGFNTVATGIASHTEGSETKAFGDFGHAEGALTHANNSSSHAEGLETISSGLASHTEGGHTEATQDCAHAEGYYTHAIGQYTHAEGCETIAEGGNAHAEGRNTHAEGWESHAEGGSTYAAGGTSHAEGDTTVAIGGGSHAEGYHTVATANHSHAEGRYNEIDEEGNYVHIVGNGYYDEVNKKEVRSNAHTIDWLGNGWFAGNLIINGDKTVATTEYVNTEIKTVEEIATNAEKIATNAEKIAKGRATGYVFDTLNDLNIWLENKDNINNLKLGDNLYIRAVDVPDYWWDGENKQPLETEKPDFSDYVEKTDYATGSKAGLVRPANGLFISGTTGALLIAKASNAQIDAKTDNYYPIVPSNLDYAVKSVLNTIAEEWTFTLEDGSTVTKKVVVV